MFFTEYGLMTPSLPDFQDYKEYIRAAIAAAPRKGHGQLSRMAEAAQIHKTTLSQILHGNKDLSPEQALRVAQFLSLNSSDTEYFVLLVLLARAGSADLQTMYRRQIESKRKERLSLANRVTRDRELGEEERAIYYSNWIYSAARNLTAVPGFRRRTELARRLSIEPNYADEVITFLLRTGLCVEKTGELLPGPQMTHLPADSPIVSRHHGNWRVKAMERHPQLNRTRELAYTAPMTLSEADALKVRAMLADLVQRTDEVVGPSPSEKLYCMCLDWFEVK